MRNSIVINVVVWHFLPALLLPFSIMSIMYVVFQFASVVSSAVIETCCGTISVDDDTDDNTFRRSSLRCIASSYRLCNSSTSLLLWNAAPTMIVDVSTPMSTALLFCSLSSFVDIRVVDRVRDDGHGLPETDFLPLGEDDAKHKSVVT